MIVFAREVFVCKCSTDVPADDPEANELARKMRFVRGGERELTMLDKEHHNDEHIADFKKRLARGEHWMVGLVGLVDVVDATPAASPPRQDPTIVTYTWLHEPERRACEYPYLPGCVFEVTPDVGYGYDAWTPPDLRGGGLRRRAFLEELHILRSYGKKWEASFFVKHQLEGATRSLGKVGIVIEPLWRVTLKANKQLAVENLAPGDTSTKPAFTV